MSRLTAESLAAVSAEKLAGAVRAWAEEQQPKPSIGAVLAVVDLAKWSEPKCGNCANHPGCPVLEYEGPGRVCPNPRRKDEAPCPSFDNFDYTKRPPCPGCGEWMNWESEDSDYPTANGGWICENRKCHVCDGCGWFSDEQVEEYNGRAIRAIANSLLDSGVALAVPGDKP